MSNPYKYRPMKLSEHTDTSWERMFDEALGNLYLVTRGDRIIDTELTLEQAKQAVIDLWEEERYEDRCLELEMEATHHVAL